MSHKILITGTTSGLGLALMEYYTERGWEVVAVNRRTLADVEKRFPKVRFLLAEISDEQAVLKCCYDLGQKNFIPDVLILNAGINRLDNNSQLEMNEFKQVLNTNLY